MPYRRVGRSGLHLPAVSVGLWQNFGDVDPLANQRAILRRAFDLGVTHFDLANNYGPPYGSAEINFGRLLAEDFRPYRDELVISTKAGYDMWPGPYGDWGSRKYLLASLDASLARMGLDYVDIFYSHRADPETPLEETMGALHTAVDLGPGAVRGDLVLLAGTDRAGRRDPGRSGHAAADPPAVVLDAEPVDRGRAAGHPRRARRRLHRVLAAGPGHADRSVSGRGPGGFPGVAGRLAVHEPAHRRGAVAHQGAQRDRRRARSVAGRDGAGLGAARRAGDDRAGRGVVGGAAGGQPRRGREPGLRRRRAGRHRKHAVDTGINLWSPSSAV